MTQQYTILPFRVTDDNGAVISGAKLNFYESGTSTPVTVYSDSALTTPISQPVLSDSSGLIQQIFLAVDEYKIIVKDSDDTTIKTIDEVEVPSIPVLSTQTFVLSGGEYYAGIDQNNQTGTTYTLQHNDWAKVVTLSNSSDIAVTVPDPTGSTFIDKWFCWITNIGTSKAVLTATSNINGVSTYDLYPNFSVGLVSDGSTYYTIGGVSADTIFRTGSELTISSGAVTVVSPFAKFSIDTESDASSDDLDTISGGVDGKVIVISSANDARDVVVKHNTGNIYNPAGQDITLGKTQDIVELRYDATLTKWIVMSYQNADTELKPLTQGTEQASTSGTEIDFTVPSGVKSVTVLFNGVSTDGTDVPLVQIGDSGGVETTSYNARGGYGTAGTTSTAGFPLSDNYAAAQLIFGSFTLNNLDGANEWIGSGTFSLIGGTNKMTSTAGVKELSAELTTIRITTTGGTHAFDAGSINILYQK